MNNCYCGHPGSRHRVINGAQYIYNDGACLHCACKEYESQEPKALEEGLTQEEERNFYEVAHSTGGPIVFTPVSTTAKPQDEPRCCDKCNIYQPNGRKRSYACVNCPCHQESETEAITERKLAEILDSIYLRDGKWNIQQGIEFILKSLEK